MDSNSKYLETCHFGTWLFPFSGEREREGGEREREGERGRERERPTLLGPLERANLNYCTQQMRCLPPLTCMGKQLLLVVRTVRNTNTVGRMQSYNVLKYVVHIVTTRL
jgi:hypothetical protein